MDSLNKHENDLESTTTYYNSTELEDCKTFIGHLDLIKEYCPGKTILDIGCSTGTFLSLAEQEGYSAVGVEVNKKALQICKKKGLEVYPSIPDRKFDIIHLSEVIEHFTNPYGEIAEIRRHLSPNERCTIFLTTPNTNSLARHLMGWRWIPWKPSEHIFLFDPITITILLNHLGFKVLLIKKSKRYRSLKTIITRLNETLGFTLIKPFGEKVSFNIPFEGNMTIIATPDDKI